MNKKLYIGNLPFSAEESTLRTHFAAEGRQVASVKIMMDRETGRSRGFAFVEMATPEDAQKAIAALHNSDFMGRPLTVNEAREPGPRVEGGFGGSRPGFGSGGGISRGPRPNGSGFGGGGGFNRGPGPITGGGFGAGTPPPADADPAADRGARGRDHTHGKDRDRDRRKRGGSDDEWG